MSKKYIASIPITGIAVVEVKASSEEEAIEEAMEADLSVDDIVEWDAHELIIEGNIFHGLQNEIRVGELEYD